MAYELISTSPAAQDFTPLSEHQEQTPGSFFAAKPVLHHYCSGATVELSEEDAATHPDFASLSSDSSSEHNNRAALIEVWVTSKFLALFSQSKSRGIQIPYSTITIHAMDGGAVLLELNLSDPNTADEDLQFLQLRIVPATT